MKSQMIKFTKPAMLFISTVFLGFIGSLFLFIYAIFGFEVWDIL